MSSTQFPDFVRRLPQADLPFEGLRGWLLQSDEGQVLFNESDIELAVPAHSHGNQWGTVIDGKIELTIGGEKRLYQRGDSYFIPANTTHSAVIYPGFRAVDYFADKDRYQPKK
jgi:mannose-6-phosphate isomerase-like protein (cupin superfamily)